MEFDDNQELVTQEDISVIGSQHSSWFMMSLSYESLVEYTIPGLVYWGSAVEIGRNLLRSFYMHNCSPCESPW